jgi:hypothetical protein
VWEGGKGFLITAFHPSIHITTMTPLQRKCILNRTFIIFSIVFLASFQSHLNHISVTFSFLSLTCYDDRVTGCLHSPHHSGYFLGGLPWGKKGIKRGVRKGLKKKRYKKELNKVTKKSRKLRECFLLMNEFKIRFTRRED